MHHRNADRTIKYKTWSSWKSIPQHSISQAFLATSPFQTYSTLYPVSSHLSTSETSGAQCWWRCRGDMLLGTCWRTYYVAGCRSLGQDHISRWGRTTSLRRCEKYSRKGMTKSQVSTILFKKTWRTTWEFSANWHSFLHWVRQQPFTEIVLALTSVWVFFLYVPFWTKMSVFQVVSDHTWLMFSKLRNQHQNPRSFGVCLGSKVAEGEAK